MQNNLSCGMSMNISIETLIAVLSVIAAIVSALCAWRSQQKSSYLAYDSSYNIVLAELTMLCKIRSLYIADTVNTFNSSSELQPAEMFNIVWPRVKNIAYLVRVYVEADDSKKREALMKLVEEKTEIDRLLELFQPWAFALHQCHMIVYEHKHLRTNAIFDKRLKLAQTRAMRELFAVMIVRIEGMSGMNHVGKNDFEWIKDYAGNNDNLKGTICEAVFRVITSPLISSDDIKTLVKGK